MAIVGVGIYVLFSGEAFIEKKGMILASVSGNFGSSGEVEYLKEKNQKLELEMLNLKKGNPKVIPDKTVEAKVFSAYPFSNRSEVLINIGADKGVRVGAAVIGNGFLIGRIREIRGDISVVTTVFDNDFKLPVRVGDKEIDALYIGGLNPRLDLIDATCGVASGDLAVSAASDLPYGIGVARTVKVTEGVMKEAVVLPLFEVKDLRNVFVVTD